MNSTTNELTTEDWISLIDEIDNLHVENLFITGGEPLLRDDLFDILNNANFKNIKTTGLLTNGTLIDSENIDDICENFNVVQIALDGVNKKTHEISRGKNTFDRVLNSIELLKSAHDSSKLDQVLISMTVFEENKAEVSEMVRFAYSKNCNMSFFNVLPAGRANKFSGLHWLTSDEYNQIIIDAYRTFNEIIDENLMKGKKTSFYIKPSNVNYGSIYTTEPIHNCGLGIKELSIGSDGTVYPCRGLHFSDLSVGNIKDNKLYTLYQKSVERFSDVSVDKNIVCKNCNLKYFCGGGCRLYGYLNGELNGNDPNCKLHEISIYSAMLCKDKNVDELIDTIESMYKISLVDLKYDLLMDMDSGNELMNLSANVTFCVKSGTIFGLLGQNGAGKSTIINMLTCQSRPNSGTAYIDGFNILTDSTEIKRRIGVVFESQNLYEELSIYENLNFFRRLYGSPTKKISEVLQAVNMKKNPKDKVKTLSKGLKQKVMIARALINDPDVLFLDEPSSGLDPRSAREVRQMIIDLKMKGKTVLITTHDMEEADLLCDNLAIIHKGIITALNTPKNLKKEYGKDIIRIETISGEIHESQLNTKESSNIFKNLSDNNKIFFVHSEEATIEDVFIKLTGERLSDKS